MKVNLPRVFEVAFQDMMADEGAEKTVPGLWDKFAFHLERCVSCVKAGSDVHTAHMRERVPGTCHGPAVLRAGRKGRGRVGRQS